MGSLRFKPKLTKSQDFKTIQPRESRKPQFVFYILMLIYIVRVRGIHLIIKDSGCNKTIKENPMVSDKYINININIVRNRTTILSKRAHLTLIYFLIWQSFGTENQCWIVSISLGASQDACLLGTWSNPRLPDSAHGFLLFMRLGSIHGFTVTVPCILLGTPWFEILAGSNQLSES